jgi:hypothetical protein
MKRRAAGALLGAWIACSPGTSPAGEGDVRQNEASEYLPAVPGATWVYAVRGDSGLGYHHARGPRLELRLGAPTEIDVAGPAPGPSMRARVFALLGGWIGADYVASSPEALRLYAARSEEGGPIAPAVLTADLRFAGASGWESGAPPDTIGHVRGARSGEESVRVPAGDFRCVRFEQQESGWRATLWLASGVGLVRMVVERRVGDGTRSETWELLEHAQPAADPR